MADVQVLYNKLQSDQLYGPRIVLYTWKYSNVQKFNMITGKLKSANVSTPIYILTFYDFSFEPLFDVPGNTVAVLARFKNDEDYKYCAITTRSITSEIKKCMNDILS